MSAVQVRRAGEVAEVVLSRPEKLNAMNMAWVTGLVDAVAELERDKPGIVVVRGEGRAFCAGLDLDMLATESMPDGFYALQEEAFVGRCGDVGDDLGSRIVAARLVRDVMRLCFLLERRYAPYSKWFGTAFARLACAGRLGPRLTAVLAASSWQEREAHLADAYEAAARLQNALALIDPLDPTPRRYHDRPYRVIHAERFATALSGTIRDEELRHLIESVGLVGAVDQFADSADILSHAGRSHLLGDFLRDD